MLGNATEQDFLVELEFARAMYQKTLLDLGQAIAFCEPSGAAGGSDAEKIATALHTVMRRLAYASEVYDMALLQLTNSWRRWQPTKNADSQ